jgi:hypothetical protein
MDGQDICFRVRVKTTVDGVDDLVRVNAISPCDEQVQKKWIERVSQLMLPSITRASGGGDPDSESTSSALRPWDIVLGLDGSVTLLAVPADSDSAGSSTASSGMYPAHYRIPPATIADLSTPCRVKRQGLFAYGTLLYELGHGRTPFEELGLDEHQVQRRYERADFPEDVMALPFELFVAVLAAWSVEFSETCEFLPPRLFVNALLPTPRWINQHYPFSPFSVSTTTRNLRARALRVRSPGPKARRVV